MSSQEIDERKVMFLRLYEELLTSSEDLLYWVTGLLMKNRYPAKCNNIWDFMLMAGTTSLPTQKLLKELSSLAKYKKGVSLLRPFGLEGRIEEIAEFGKSTSEEIEPLLNKLLDVIKACNSNRRIKKAILTRGQIKIKHGMVVIGEDDGIYIRDMYLTTVSINSKKHIRSYNKNLFLRLDDARAKGMLDTISATSVAIQIVITLLLFQYGDIVREIGKKKKLSKNDKEFLSASLNN